jgi:hypothetical protein
MQAYDACDDAGRNASPLEGLDAFGASHAAYQALVATLASAEAGGWTHDQVEEHLEVRGREVLRRLYQDHLDLRALREQHAVAQGRVVPISDAQGIGHRKVEPGHRRRLATVFGTVQVTRCAWRADGARNLYPADARLNLPDHLHSHTLQQRAAVERCAARSTTPSRRLCANAATWSANARSSSSPSRRPATSTPSTPRRRRSRPPMTRCWCSVSTAKAS